MACEAVHQEHSRVRIRSAQPPSPRCARLPEILRKNYEEARRSAGFLRQE